MIYDLLSKEKRGNHINTDTKYQLSEFLIHSRKFKTEEIEKCKQHKDDESASVLLERIKAEKEVKKVSPQKKKKATIVK